MDRTPYTGMVAVMCLAAIAMSGTIGMVAIAVQGHEIPGALIAVTTTAVGAIAGALVVPPRGNGSHPTILTK